VHHQKVKQHQQEYVNDYFIYIASLFVEKLPPCSGRFGDAHVIHFYQNQNVSDNMFGLVSVTVGQISSILNSISASKATGLDKSLQDLSKMVLLSLQNLLLTL